MSAITERPVLRSIRLQTFNITDPTPFFLGYSRLGVATLGTGNENIEDQWTDWTPNIVQLSTMRGGTQDGISIRNDTGVLTARLRNVPISTNTPVFITGQRIRLQHISGLGIPTTIYTGRILDVIAGNTLDGIGRITPVIELNAVDNYVNHDQTTRYGAMPPTGTETFTQRIARLTQTATAPIEPPVLNRAPIFGPWSEHRRNRFRSPILYAQTWSTPDATVADRSDANGHYIRATTAPTASALWWLFIDEFTRVPVTVGEEIELSLNARIVQGAPEIGMQAVWMNSSGGIFAFGEIEWSAGQDWNEITTGGTAPSGAVYVGLSVFVAEAAGGVIDLKDVYIGTPGDYFDGNTNPTGEVERTRWVGPVNASPSVIETRERIGWDPLPDTDAILGRTVYESSLANHFTLACNTVGAMWWVGADGITRFAPREYDPYSPLTFLGAQPPTRPDNALHYIRATASGGSAGFFNRARMHNHGAAIDPDNGGWIADDHDVTTTNLGGIFGFSDATVDTNHADLNAHDAPTRFYRWLVPTMSFGAKATSITWNAQENLERIPDLEIGRSVYLPTDYLDRDPWPWNVLIGIRHTITPTRWMVELTLIGVANP